MLHVSNHYERENDSGLEINIFLHEHLTLLCKGKCIFLSLIIRRGANNNSSNMSVYLSMGCYVEHRIN
jgi:collagenase-like PrtC family protease